MTMISGLSIVDQFSRQFPNGNVTPDVAHSWSHHASSVCGIPLQIMFSNISAMFSKLYLSHVNLRRTTNRRPCSNSKLFPPDANGDRQTCRHRSTIHEYPERPPMHPSPPPSPKTLRRWPGGTVQCVISSNQLGLIGINSSKLTFSVLPPVGLWNPHAREFHRDWTYCARLDRFDVIGFINSLVLSKRDAFS